MASPHQSLQGNRFSSDTDEDLLFFMSLKGDDQESADLAWAEFFERHWKYLLGVCKKSYLVSLGDLGVEDLTTDTFIRAYQMAHRFTPAENGSSDYKRQRVRAWLGAIANRLFLSSWRQQPNIVYVDDSTFDTLEPEILNEADGNADIDPVRKALLHEALATLTERERGVLVASYACYDDALGCHRMPNSEIAALAAKYQTTTVNIRQIRSRAKEKLEKYIEIRQVKAGRRNDAKL